MAPWQLWRERDAMAVLGAAGCLLLLFCSDRWKRLVLRNEDCTVHREIFYLCRLMCIYIYMCVCVCEYDICHIISRTFQVSTKLQPQVLQLLNGVPQEIPVQLQVFLWTQRRIYFLLKDVVACRGQVSKSQKVIFFGPSAVQKRA